MANIAQLTERMRLWLRRKRDWDACFKRPGSEELSEAGLAVLKEIAQFANAYKTTAVKTMAGTIDPIAMAHAEGQRSVYLLVQRRLKMTDDQILSMTEKAHD